MTAGARDQLKSIIERIERLEEEKKAISDDVRDVYAEAKRNGFDVKALRAIVRLRKLDADERAEEQAVLETYLAALGMLPGGEVDEERLKPKRKTRGAGKACRIRIQSDGDVVVSAAAGRVTRRTGSLPDGEGRGSCGGTNLGAPAARPSLRPIPPGEKTAAWPQAP